MYDNSLYIIIESPIVEDYSIISESKTENGNYTYKIKTVLQKIGEINKNNRLYSREVLFESIQTNIIPKLVTSSGRYKLIGELDHPVPTGNLKADMVRQGIPMYERASHKFLKIWFDGDYVMGEVETLTTPYGNIMTSLIRDNIEVGFSLRAFGRLVPNTREGYVVVQKPLKLITWDCVSNPSHSEAVLQEISENEMTIPFSNQKETMSMLHESYDMGVSNKGICLDDICYNTIENAVSIRLDHVVENWNNQVKRIKSIKSIKESKLLK